MPQFKYPDATSAEDAAAQVKKEWGAAMQHMARAAPRRSKLMCNF
jgi:hypothetical protein